MSRASRERLPRERPGIDSTSGRPAAGLRRVLLLAGNDLRLAVKDRGSLIWMLLLPLALMWLFGARGGGTPQIYLAVDDRDRGWLARALVEELRDEQVNLIELEPDGAAGTGAAGTGAAGTGAAGTGAAGTEDGEESRPRVLVLPEGLTADLLAGQKRRLRLELDPDANGEFSMGAEVHVQRAIGRVLGRLLLIDAAPGGRPADAGEVERRYAELAARPAAVSLESKAAGIGRQVPSGYAQSVPGILTMVVLMMTLIYGGVFLIQEKQQGMLRRQLALPASRRQVIAGKIAGRLAIAALQIVLLVAAGRFLFGLDLGRSPLGLVLLLASYAVAVAGLATLLGAVLHTTEQASTVGWILSMVLAGLGGSWWPAELMPEWLQTAAHALPTAWAMDGFHALISFGHGAQAVLLPSAVLLAFGALFMLLAARWLKAE